MKQTVIPSGYRITVKSWENDGDNYNTKVVEGLTLEQTKFVVDLCKLLKRGEYSNLYEPSESEIENLHNAIEKILNNHGAGIFECENPEHAVELLYDFGLSCGEYYTRVCDWYKVEYIPAEIVLQDVTEQFK